MAASGSLSASEISPAAHPAEVGKWLVAASVLLGSFLSVMDTTVVNVAMPHMMGSFGTDLITITWVSTAYSIAEIIMITMSAFWSRLLGRRRFYLFSMSLFLFGSVLAGQSRTLGQMIFFRVLQGVGGGSLMPLSQAIVREKFPPEEQAMAMAIYSMGVVVAPAIGPVIGGYLIDRLGWPWVFYINVPFCITGLLMVQAFVSDPPYFVRGFQRIDWGGITLLTLGLTTLQIVLESGERLDWFASRAITIGAALAAVSLVSLVLWEIFSKEPVINFRLFRNLPLTVGSTYVSIIGFGLFGSTFVLPAFTQELLGYPALQAGLVMIPRSIAMFIMMPVSGFIYNYIDPRIQVTAAVVLQTLSYWMLSRFNLAVGFWTFLPSTVLMGIGLANSNVIMATMSLATVPRPLMTQASALFTLSRRVSGNMAYAILATMIARRTQFHRARLVDKLNTLSAPYLQIHGGLASQLMHQGVSIQRAQTGASAVVERMVNAQATMLAYNDLYSFLFVLFIFALPFVWAVPKAAFPKAEPGETKGEIE